MIVRDWIRTQNQQQAAHAHAEAAPNPQGGPHHPGQPRTVSARGAQSLRFPCEVQSLGAVLTPRGLEPSSPPLPRCPPPPVSEPSAPLAPAAPRGLGSGSLGPRPCAVTCHPPHAPGLLVLLPRGPIVGFPSRAKGRKKACGHTDSSPPHPCCSECTGAHSPRRRPHSGAVFS